MIRVTTVQTPKVLLVAKDSRTRSLFCRQICDYFHDSIELLTEEPRDMSNLDLILLTSRNLARNNFPQSKLLICRRSIDVSKLEQLIAMPDTSKCLVANNMKDTACETVLLLKNLGFSFEMVPYYPESQDPIPDVDAAIIPGAIDFLPPGNFRVINIGVRPLDLSSLVEIALKLHLPIDRSNIYVARYTHEIVQLSRKLSSTIIHLKSLNSELDTILNTVHDGIVATDANGHITRMNRSACEILDSKRDIKEWIGSDIQELFPYMPSDNTFLRAQENLLIKTNDKHFVLNNTPITVTSGKTKFVSAFQDVTRIQQLEQHLRHELQTKGLSSKYKTEHIIGKSPAIKQVIDIMHKIAKSDNTVIIFGESGTGKELIAHSIHSLSPRRDGPFLPVNFAGLPQSLAESELFGYDEGTFTGARRGGKAGLFELAHNGTIFLDEIGDAPMALQALLLRVLQEKHIMRVGGRKVIPINVRVFSATNRDLKQLVEQGTFRQDLYYRLNVLPIRVPTLRERRDDIPVLIEHFLEEISSERIHVSQKVMERLMSHDWPGNVRELVSVIQYLVTVMDGKTITLRDLPGQFDTPDVPIKNTSRFVDHVINLQQHGNLMDFYIMLKCLVESEENGIRVGRGSIMQYCANNQSEISEQQVRKRMEILGQFNYLTSGTRGQGSRVTERGREALQQLEHYLESALNPH